MHSVKQSQKAFLFLFSKTICITAFSVHSLPFHRLTLIPLGALIDITFRAPHAKQEKVGTKGSHELTSTISSETCFFSSVQN